MSELQRFLFVVAPLSIALVSCSYSGSAVISNPQTAARAIDFSRSQGYLYIANSNPQNVIVYRIGEQSPTRVIRHGFACSSPVALGVDHRGNLYVAKNYCGGNSVVVYSNNGLPIRSITKGVLDPTAIDFDASGNLYVSNLLGPPYHLLGAVAKYSPGQTHPDRILTDGICAPRSVLIDDHGTTYVANEFCGPSEKGSIAIYAGLGKTFRKSIYDGISHPVSLAMDRSGTLYVLNQSPPSVSLYDTQTLKLRRIIKRGVGSRGTRPTAIVSTPEGDLYVANAGLPPNRGYVGDYHRGRPEPSRLITDLIYSPSAIVLDNSGNLYVANAGDPGYNAGWISIYRPSGRPMGTITAAVAQPVGLALSDR